MAYEAAVKAIAHYYGGHRAPVVLTEEQEACFLAPYGPHQTLADELREDRCAQRLVVRHWNGAFLAESTDDHS